MHENNSVTNLSKCLSYKASRPFMGIELQGRLTESEQSAQFEYGDQKQLQRWLCLTSGQRGSGQWELEAEIQGPLRMISLLPTCQSVMTTVVITEPRQCLLFSLYTYVKIRKTDTGASRPCPQSTFPRMCDFW